MSGYTEAADQVVGRAKAGSEGARSDLGPVNVVRLRGRITAAPEPRTLPSGTVVVGFRLVVPRTPTAMTKGSRQKSDWFHCTAWGAAQRRRVSPWGVGDVVEVEGALRRRQFRSAAGVGSLVEVEVLAGRCLERAPKRPD